MARIEWQKPSPENFKKADEAAQVIVLYFGDRDDADVWFNDVDVDGLVLAGAVACLRVNKPDGETEPAPTESRVPASRLDSGDLWRAYGVDEADTFVVADRYGNAMTVTRECALKDKVTDVSKHFRAKRKELRKLTREADKLADDDLPGAIAKLHEGFELGLVGYKEAEAAGELYTKLMDAARKEVTAAGEDLDALRELSETYAGSDIAKEIDAALEKAEKVSG